MHAAYPEVVFAGAASASALAGAVCDLRSRRIPNLLTGGSLLAGLALHLWLGGGADMGASLAAGLLAGLVLLVLYAAGGMGAGDVKLMAALGAIGGWPLLLPMLLGTALSGMVLALALALYHRRLRETVMASVRLMAAPLRAPGAQGAPNTLGALSAEGPLPLPPPPPPPPPPLAMPFAVPIAFGCLCALYQQL